MIACPLRPSKACCGGEPALDAGGLGSPKLAVRDCKETVKSILRISYALFLEGWFVLLLVV